MGGVELVFKMQNLVHLVIVDQEHKILKLKHHSSQPTVATGAFVSHIVKQNLCSQMSLE